MVPPPILPLIPPLSSLHNPSRNRSPRSLPWVDTHTPQLLTFMHPQSTSDSEATQTHQAFDRRVEDVKPCKTDINFVVLDYLVNEGFPEAAKKFAAEANIQQASGDGEFIEERVEIRNAILSGNIQGAVEKINDLTPEAANLGIAKLLEQNTVLHFSLLRLQLIELIRTCMSMPDADIAPALDFAQNQLAPLAPTNPTFVADLEKTMALLIFPADGLSPQLQALLNTDLRVKVSERVNEALLEEMGCSGVSRLRRLARLRMWAERKAREHSLDITSSGLDLWGQSLGNGESNGNGDIAMAA